MVMLIFGVLGVTMVTLFSTSITATAEPSESRRALYLYESGVRYGMSQMRNIGFTDATINTLNRTTYNMPPSGQFEVNVFSPKPLEKIIPVKISPKKFPPLYSPANDMVQRTSGINASFAWHVASISFNPQTRNSYFHTRYIFEEEK
jgi:hypothetical protein